jgi:DNA-binding response OmpR family regulator
LVVDDSPTDLRRLSEPLRRSGYRVLTARDGEQALSQALLERPTLVLLDAVLPCRNGFLVCRDLKANPHTAGVKVLLVVSKGLRDDRRGLLKQDADGYLTRPVAVDELLEAVTRLLGR